MKEECKEKLKTLLERAIERIEAEELLEAAKDATIVAEFLCGYKKALSEEALPDGFRYAAWKYGFEEFKNNS